MKIVFLITRADIGGAQGHLFSLLDKMRHSFNSHLVVGSHGPLVDRVSQIGVPVTVVPSLVRSISPAKDLRALLELYKILRAIRPALVSIHSSKAGFLGRLAARMAKVPAIVFTAHGWAFTEGKPYWQRYVYAQAERLAGALTTKIICVSDYDRCLALKWKIAPSEKIDCIYNGVDAEPYLNAQGMNVRREFRLGDACVLTTVGRLAAEKDFPTLFHAVHCMTDLNVKVLLVGEGPLRRKVENFIARKGLQERVVMTGMRRDIPEILAASDIFVLTSRWEGLPLTVIEAMCAGLPVVASKVGGVPELVQEGVTGHLVQPRDPRELCDTLRTLICDARRRDVMGNAGRMRAMERFAGDSMIESTRTAFEQLLSKEAGSLAGARKENF